MLCQAVAFSPPCCCESEKAVLSFTLHRVFPGNNLSVLSWKRVVSPKVEWPTWTRSCAACCRWPCFSRRVGLDDPQRSLPTPNILWFYDKVARYSPSSLWTLQEGWCNLCTDSELKSGWDLDRLASTVGWQLCKVRKTQNQFCVPPFLVSIWEKACMDNLLFPR